MEDAAKRLSFCQAQGHEETPGVLSQLWRAKSGSVVRASKGLVGWGWEGHLGSRVLGQRAPPDFLEAGGAQ